MFKRLKKALREIIEKLEEDGNLSMDELVEILKANKYTLDELKKWAGYRK